MTTASDLLKTHGVRQRLYVRVDGIPERIWQDDGTGSPPSWDTTGKVGLLPPTEISMGLDVTTFKAEAAAQTFQFLDIKDTDGKSWWGKKLATSAWDVSNHWRVNVASAPQTYVDCNAVNIPIKDNTNFPAAGGTFYMGNETLNVDNAASNVLQGCEKGLYSSIRSGDREEYTFGQSYLRPQAADGQYQMTVGDVPFTFHGRRVALYVTTWDTATGEWNNDGAPVQIWTDTFGDGSRDSKWTDTVSADGTITETGGNLVIAVPVGGDCSWGAGAANKTCPRATVNMSDIRTTDEALFCAEMAGDYTCGQSGLTGPAGFGIMEDTENCWLWQIYTDGDVKRLKALADTFSDSGTLINQSDRTGWIGRVYWNTHTTKTYSTLPNGDSLAPGHVKMYATWDSGSTWTELETAASYGFTANSIVIYAMNYPAGPNDPTLTANYLTVTQTAASGATELLWTGRVSNTIQFKPNPSKEEGHWKLGCESVLADLDKSVCNDLHRTKINGINLTGSVGRTFCIVHSISGAAARFNQSVTVDAGWYADKWQLVHQINKQLASITFATLGATVLSLHIDSSGAMYVKDDQPALTGGPMYDFGLWQYDKFDWLNHNKTGHYCHALGALGFGDPDEPQIIQRQFYPTKLRYIGYANYGKAYDAYHPIGYDPNGGKLYLEDALGMWDDQGDNSSTCGSVAFDKEIIYSDGEKRDVSIVMKYTGILDDTSSWLDSEYLALGPFTDMFDTTRKAIGFDTKKSLAYFDDGGDNSGEVRQVYTPYYELISGTSRGVFETLLYPLLSTGTPKYNHTTYDKCPLDLSMGIQSDIVDVQSFLNADMAISSSPFSDRDLYVIAEPTSWIDLLLREAMLFGFAVTWDRGKIRLKDVTLPNRAGASVTLDESNCATRTEKPLIDMSESTVVNSYECHLATDPYTGKQRPPIIVSDADSVYAFGEKSVKIEHPGLSLWLNSTGVVREALKLTLLGRPMRFPAPILERTLAPQLLNLVYPGDLVLLVSGDIPDPDGSGDFDFSKYALVLDASWNHRTKTGSCKLMPLTHYKDWGNPWAPAALITAHSSAVITLAAHEFGNSTNDPEDGTAFSATDEVNIIERAPSDPTSATVWRRTINDAYGTAGARQFTLSSTLGSFDATKEYLLTFADYGNVTTGQKTRGMHQASTSTELLDGDTRANRYG